jgi:hypothetical protein
MLEKWSRDGVAGCYADYACARSREEAGLPRRCVYAET